MSQFLVDIKFYKLLLSGSKGIKRTLGGWGTHLCGVKYPPLLYARVWECSLWEHLPESWIFEKQPSMPARWTVNASMRDKSKSSYFFLQLIKKSKSFLHNSSVETESIDSAVRKTFEGWIQLSHRVKSHFLPFSHIFLTVPEHCPAMSWLCGYKICK